MVELFYVKYNKEDWNEKIGSGTMVSIEDNQTINTETKLKHEMGYRMLNYYLKGRKNIKSHFELEKCDGKKPRISNIKNVMFNISHSENLVIIGFCGEEIGVDCEKIRKCRDNVVNRIFTKNQKENLEQSKNRDRYFTSIWTLKESFAKNMGIGIGYPLETIEVYRDKSGNLVNCMEGYTFTQFDIEDNIVSICTISDSNVRVEDITTLIKEDILRGMQY